MDLRILRSTKNWSTKYAPTIMWSPWSALQFSIKSEDVLTQHRHRALATLHTTPSHHRDSVCVFVCAEQPPWIANHRKPGDIRIRAWRHKIVLATAIIITASPFVLFSFSYARNLLLSARLIWSCARRLHQTIQASHSDYINSNAHLIWIQKHIYNLFGIKFVNLLCYISNKRCCFGS